MDVLLIKEDIKIENLIYEVRGQYVMLDSDLAKLYQCKNGTKEINQAVRNNEEKFPPRFAFRITEKEYNFLKSKNLTSKGGARKGHTVFTEQGVAMLATILKTRVATQVSIAIMDAFVTMRHYIGNSEYRLSNVETKIIEHDKNIKLLQESFDKLSEKAKPNEIYFEGQIYDAYSKIKDILNMAKEELIIIDRYADKSVLDLIREINVRVTLIVKKKSLLTKTDIDKYNKQYNNLNIIYDDTFHDRYFILDKKEVYHCGASINHAGSKTFSINKLEDKIVVELLIEKTYSMGK